MVAVGVIDVAPPQSPVPIRLFYPTTHELAGNQPRARVFVRSLSYMAVGYSHTFVLLPGAYQDAPFAKPATDEVKLIVFSHGLSGTSEEHAFMFARWVEQGYVVACCHHCDGSSSRVPKADGTDMWYKHGPSKEKKYKTRSGITSTTNIPKTWAIIDEIRQAVDHDCVIAAGYSYGAATAALTATHHHGLYQSCMLLDGWFYVDMSNSANVEFEFPAAAFADGYGGGLRTQAIFVNGEQFSRYKKLYGATKRLAAKVPNEMHVIKDAKHHNFTDLVFWLPRWVLNCLQYIGVLGKADPLSSYEEILSIQERYLKDRGNISPHDSSKTN